MASGHTKKEIYGGNVVLLDKASNYQMWQNIVNKSLVGTKLLTKAALVNHKTGRVHACNPEEFTPTIEQAQVLLGGIHNPGTLAVPGIKVAGDSFSYTSGSPGDYLIGTNEFGDSEVVVHITKTVLLIGVYAKDKRDAAKSLCNGISDYIKGQGL